MTDVPEAIKVRLCICGCPEWAHFSLYETNSDHASSFGRTPRRPCMAGTAYAKDLPYCKGNCWDFAPKGIPAKKA